MRDVTFGANDGLVSILSLLAGVYGVVTESRVILIAGVAGAVAGAISMSAGAYLSSNSDTPDSLVTQATFASGGGESCIGAVGPKRSTADTPAPDGTARRGSHS